VGFFAMISTACRT